MAELFQTTEPAAPLEIVPRTLLRWLLPGQAREIVVGDVAEEFAAMERGLGAPRF